MVLAFAFAGECIVQMRLKVFNFNLILDKFVGFGLAVCDLWRYLYSSDGRKFEIERVPVDQSVGWFPLKWVTAPQSIDVYHD